jgi:hypothetical protein
MARSEYMRVVLNHIPATVIYIYGLEAIAVNGFVYVEINKGMYQAGILANDNLVIQL